MARPNTTFNLSVDDMELIEAALRTRKSSLAKSVEDVRTANAEVKDRLHEIHDLLGRLHNQKSFYRPKSGVYVGG